MDTTHCDTATTVFWHREMPPIDAVPMGEHTIEATSRRVRDTAEGRESLWDRGKDDLKGQTEARLIQEVARLGGHYAHVLDESTDSGHDAATGEVWLHGRYTYMLYRRPH